MECNRFAQWQMERDWNGNLWFFIDNIETIEIKLFSSWFFLMYTVGANLRRVQSHLENNFSKKDAVYLSMWQVILRGLNN